MPDEAIVMKVGDRELIVPMPKKTSRLAVPKTPNRAERRQMARSQGQRGAKAKRQKVLVGPPPESEEQRQARELHESQQKAIEAAQNMRRMTAGRLWLPGQQ